MFNRNVFAEEFISLVLRIISPDLKPVTTLLLPSNLLSSSLPSLHLIISTPFILYTPEVSISDSR
jgi:hypothetical protein